MNEPPPEEFYGTMDRVGCFLLVAAGVLVAIGFPFWVHWR